MIYVTSFSSIPYWSSSKYWPQKQSQSGNIHSIILDVHVSWQSTQNFPFFSRPSVSLFMEQDWAETEFQIEVLALIHNLMENRLMHACSGPVLLFIHKFSLLHLLCTNYITLKIFLIGHSVILYVTNHCKFHHFHVKLLCLFTCLWLFRKQLCA